MILKKANIAKVLNNVYFKKKTPISLIHFLTNRCNARCSFCFIDFDNPKTFAGELTLEEIANKMIANNCELPPWHELNKVNGIAFHSDKLL